MQILKTTRVSNYNLDFMVICHAENIMDYLIEYNGLPDWNNMIEQYINTFLETPRPNVIQTASKNFGSNDIQIVPHWIIHST